MTKQLFKGSILFGPLPAVLVTTVDTEGKPNVFTVAWTGVACTSPPMVTIAVRKERMSHANITATGEFVINMPPKELLKAVDFCGCRSGYKIDKIKHFGLELDPGALVKVPSLAKCPVALECVVRSVTELGTHDLFLAEVVQNKVDSAIIDSEGKIHFSKPGLIAYSHGEYYGLNSKPLGTFGYSVASKSVRQEKHLQRKGLAKPGPGRKLMKK